MGETGMIIVSFTGGFLSCAVLILGFFAWAVWQKHKDDDHFRK